MTSQRPGTITLDVFRQPGDGEKPKEVVRPSFLVVIDEGRMKKH